MSYMTSMTSYFPYTDNYKPCDSVQVNSVRVFAFLVYIVCSLSVSLPGLANKDVHNGPV